MNQIALENFKIDKSNWKKVRLGDVAFEPKETVKDPIKEGIKHVVGLEHIDSEDIHLRRSASIDESTTFTKKFRKGDVLFGRRRAYLKKAAVAQFDGICSGDITVMRAKIDLLPELLPFIINNNKFFDYAVTHSAGGLSPRVKFKDLSKYEIYIPQKEQAIIVSELFYSLDCLLESYYQNLTSLKTLLASIQKFLYTKTSKIHLSKYCSILGGFAFSSEAFKNSGSPVIKIKNIVDGGVIVEGEANFIEVNDFKTLDRYRVSEGDLLIAMTGATLGKLGIVPQELDGSYLNQRVGKYKFKKDFYKEFVYGLCESDYFMNELMKYIGEGAQGNISSGEIASALVPQLSDEEVLVFQKRFRNIFQAKREIENNIKQSKALMNKIANKVF